MNGVSGGKHDLLLMTFRQSIPVGTPGGRCRKIVAREISPYFFIFSAICCATSAVMRL